MKSIKSYESLPLSQIPDGYVVGYVKDNIKLAKVNVDRSVLVNALQYTKGGNSDKVDVILKDGVKTSIVKSDLDIKF